ncbi:MAG: polyprenyl synthetase family protein [Francisellaceae bacterium]
MTSQPSNPIQNKALLIQEFEPFSQRYINDQSIPSATLRDAILYSLMGGGKRIRAQLVYATADIFGLKPKQQHLLAFAVEAIHAYSLIHDDLPAMDDDKLRRGRATCHIQFGEACAILAGDALQTLAFQALGEIGDISGAQLGKLITTLSQCAGAQGMISGQMLDLESEGMSIELEALKQIHHNKTARMIEASVLLPFIASNHYQDGDIQQALTAFSAATGLAFQIQDDILDITKDSKTLGKDANSDLKHNKSTYPSLLNIDGAKSELHRQMHKAKFALQCLNSFNTEALWQLTQYICHRDH